MYLTENKFLSTVLIFICLVFFSCNLGINTTDPQASHTVKDSKGNSFFIKEFYLRNVDSQLLDLKECWMEYRWKNEIAGSKAVKIKTSGVQFNFLVTKFKKDYMQWKRYLIDWEMAVENMGVLGTGNGVYTLYSDNGRIPDSLKIEILRKDSTGFHKQDSFKVYSMK